MIAVEFLFGPSDGLRMEVHEECYQLRSPILKAAAAMLAWAEEGSPGVCHVYERDPGSKTFVYACFKVTVQNAFGGVQLVSGYHA